MIFSCTTYIYVCMCELVNKQVTLRSPARLYLPPPLGASCNCQFRLYDPLMTYKSPRRHQTRSKTYQYKSIGNFVAVFSAGIKGCISHPLPLISYTTTTTTTLSHTYTHIYSVHTYIRTYSYLTMDGDIGSGVTVKGSSRLAVAGVRA